MHKWAIRTLVSVWLFSLASLVYSIEIVSNKSLQTKDISINIARAIFSGRMKYWPDGTPVRVVMYKADTNQHRQFCSEILDVYPRQLQRSWDMIIFSGVGEGPMIVKDEVELINKINSIPGAIGYADKITTDMEVQIVKIK